MIETEYTKVSNLFTCPFFILLCGYEKLCFLKFLLTFLIIEFSEGNPPPSAKNKWAAQAFLCSDICPSFKKWGQFVRRQLKHVFRIEASKVSPSCLSKFAFFFCHPHATKEKTCLKKNLEFAMTSMIHICPPEFDVGLFRGFKQIEWITFQNKWSYMTSISTDYDLVSFHQDMTFWSLIRTFPLPLSTRLT